MANTLISLVLILSIYSCKSNTKTNTQSVSSNLQDTSQNLEDSLDVDTVYASGFVQPEPVSLFFRNTDDTLWSYVMRSYTHSNKKEILSIDSLASILKKAGYEFVTCGKFLCGFKREFNKRYNFELRLGKEITLITFFEYWFEGKRYVSPFQRHDH